MAEEKETLSWAGGRKYAFIWAAFVVATFAMFFKYGTLVEWGVIVGGLAALYFKSNYEQKKIEINKDRR